MSEENVELVRREYRVFATRDWAALAEIWHREIEYEPLMGVTFRGIDQITEFFDAYAELYSEFRSEAEEIIDTGEHVVAVERLWGRGVKGSDAGAPVIERFARVIGFKEGKIWRSKEYPTLAEALEAAGLSE